jgi:hypothetical protein
LPRSAPRSTTCPCATFANRGAYRQCGKTVIAQAVSGTTLRTQCGKTAKKLLKGGTCGA